MQALTTSRISQMQVTYSAGWRAREDLNLRPLAPQAEGPLASDAQWQLLSHR